MNTKHLYILLFTLTTCISIHSMEKPVTKLLMPEGLALPIKEIWLNIIAQCSAKYKLRQTCRYFRDLASIANDEIFLQNPLVMDQKLLKEYAFYYAELDNHGVIDNLLNQGLNPNTLNSNGMDNLLSYAVINENLTMVDTLLKHPLFVIDKHTYSNFNAALKLNYSAIAQRILTIKNIDIKEVFNRYLDCASDQNIDILTHFLSMDCHAASDIPDSAKSYVGLASQRCIDDRSLAKLLLHAAKLNHIKIATLLLKHNVDVNCTHAFYGGGSDTPLYIAAEQGNCRMLKLLVKHGANLNGARIDYPPLKKAIYFGHLNNVRFLLNCGAPLAIQPTLLAFTAKLHDRQCSIRIEIMQLLLNKGVDINEKTMVDDHMVRAVCSEHGDSALSITTRFGKIDAMKVLLAHPEINVNIKTDNDKTPLDIAIENPHRRDVVTNKAVIDLLIAHGAKRSAELAQLDEHNK